MRAGLLRHLVTLEQRTDARDAYGEPLDAWTPYATVRAEIQPLNGREYFAAAAEASEVTTRIRIRYVTGLTTALRVRFHGLAGEKIYNIVSIIDPDERHRELVLMCSTGLNQGG